MRTHLKILLLCVLTMAGFPCQAQSPAKQPEEKTIAVFGQTIRYWDAGSGPVVVLVHGLGSSKEGDWGQVIVPLSQQYRVIAMDQIGFGHSEKPLLEYKIQTYVDFLNEFLRELKVQNASLIGESLGGWISALYTTEISSAHLVPVQKLVLVDAAGLKQEQPIPNLNPSTLEDMRKVLEAVFFDTSWVNEQVLKKSLTDKLAKRDSYTVHSILTNPGLATERLDDRLGEIHVPTLVVWGKQDKLLPITSGERYATGIPGAKLVSFEKCGHVPPIEKSKEFLSAVEEFLGDGVVKQH